MRLSTRRVWTAMKAHRCVLSAGLRLTQHSVGLAGGEGGEPQDPGSTLPASYYDALSGCQQGQEGRGHEEGRKVDSTKEGGA
eukprot:783276-Rhodomonas_salina.1